MAKVFAKIVGGSTVTLEASSLSEVRTALGNDKSTATVNGRPVDESYVIKADDFIVLSEQVKGNAKAPVSNAIYASKELSLVVVNDKANNRIIVNGEPVKKSDAIKMAKAILVLAGYSID